jgi:Na+-driven multidrug efflux pump
MGLTFAIRVYNSTIIVGVLRGGGDTTFGMIIDTLSVWLIGVPIAFISVLVFELPIYYVFALVTIEELFKLIATTPRMLSKKWIKNIT